jgi:hypothetical protein
MKDFDGHNGIPLQFRGPPNQLRTQVKPSPNILTPASEMHIAHPADRFQYLSVNIP